MSAASQWIRIVKYGVGAARVGEDHVLVAVRHVVRGPVRGHAPLAAVRADPAVGDDVRLRGQRADNHHSKTHQLLHWLFLSLDGNICLLLSLPLLFVYLTMICVPFWWYTYTLLRSSAYFTDQFIGQSAARPNVPVMPLGASTIL